MKTGKTLAQFASQIKQERDSKHDFIASTSKLRYLPDQTVGRVAFKADGKQYEVAPTRHCLRQIAARSNIPAQYVDRMQGEHSPLLAENINYWWKHNPEQRMVRTLLNGDSIARAFVSDSYRPLENADIAHYILPKLANLDCEVLSCEITETRLYIQAATPRVAAKLVGDRVQAGVVIGNSEVGAGSIFVDPLLYYLRCLNGMVLPSVMRRHHVGRDRYADFSMEEAAEYFTTRTKEMADKAFWMKVCDVVDGLFDRDRFNKMVAEFEMTAEQKIKRMDQAVEEVTERFKLNDDEKNDVLNHLIEGGQPNLFGLINAITRTATDVESYDRSIELQRIGGEVMRLPKHVWN